jgi:adenylosuccinate synthase
LIGSGVVFNAQAFFKELAALEEKGLKHARENLLVSDRAQVNLELHARVDGLEEKELANKKIGTTGRGIGPSYSNKAARNGIRVHEIFDQEHFEKKLRHLAAGYKKRFGDLLEYDVEEEIARFREYREKLPEFVVDAVNYMQKAQASGVEILVEGANALMLDIDYGGIVLLQHGPGKGLADSLLKAHIRSSPAATPGWAVSLPDWPSIRGRSSELPQ